MLKQATLITTSCNLARNSQTTYSEDNSKKYVMLFDISRSRKDSECQRSCSQHVVNRHNVLLSRQQLIPAVITHVSRVFTFQRQDGVEPYTTRYSDINNSQGSAATRLKCGGGDLNDHCYKVAAESARNNF